MEIYWTSIYHNLPIEKLRKKNISNLDEEESEKNEQQENKKTIRVFDRFTMILQIFARRAKTKISKLQIELCFLHFLKTKLIREGGSTFSSFFNIFSGDLMSARFCKRKLNLF